MTPTETGRNVDPQEFLALLGRLSEFDLDDLRRHSKVFASALRAASPGAFHGAESKAGCHAAFEVLVTSAHVVRCQADHFRTRYLDGTRARSPEPFVAVS